MKDILFTGVFILGVMLLMSSCQSTIKTPQSRIHWQELSKQLKVTLVKTNDLKNLKTKTVTF